ncbi:cadherin domain-containing protein [Neobacillus soli]|uniref:cadherin domain-containing protein n=1 Tax=Neobacillus soli TaxID=220688 RepID=UPI00082624C8|nr:cadherin domain-containing protein [Neobacillus soli]
MNFKAFVAFILVLQLVLAGPLSTLQHTNAAGTKMTEKVIHEFTQNTWAYSKLADGPSGDLYLSHVKNSTEIAVKKWDQNNWNEITSIKTSATGDTGLNGPSDLTIDANNQVHSAFLFYRGSGVTSYRGVKYGVYKNGSWSFQEIEAYSDSNGWKNMSDPSVAVDANGKAHIVYLYSDAHDPRKYEVHYATNQSGAWSIKTIASGASAIDEVHDPQIEVDQNNNIHITYVKEDNQNDVYGNYYYTHKKVSDTSFSAPEKVINAVAEQKDYIYTPFAVDATGNVSFSYYEGDYYTENTPFTTYFQTNQSGTWKREVVYNDTNKISYPVKVTNKDGKSILLMYSESWDWPPSQLGFFTMVKDGGVWTKGTTEVSPSLTTVTPSELTYSVNANGNFMVVMLDDGLRKISYLNGTSEEFGLVTKPPISSNADLSLLAINPGTLSPGFSPATTSYTASVGNDVQAVQVTPTTADAKAKVKVNGTSVAGGTSTSVPLSVGSNQITVAVTAEDGKTVKTYTATVTKAAPSSNADLSQLTVSQGALDPGFSATTKDYTAYVDNNTQTIQVKPTVADSHATVTVNGRAVNSGNDSQPMDLTVGANPIRIVVTAQDGTTKTYTVTVMRAASSNTDLSQLTVSSGELNPSFNTAIKNYNVSVPNRTDQIRLTPTVADENAKVTVGGNRVTSGQASDPLSLKLGKNPILIVITAQDGTTATYTVVVHRNNPPGLTDTTFTVNENAQTGTTVGTLAADDPDGDSLSYSILSGNTDKVFDLNPATGEIKVANGSLLDFETTTSYTIAVQVSDGVDKATANLNINVNDLNDNLPVPKGFTKAIDENTATGTAVGTVTATDGDAGSHFTYKITAGNTGGAFAIDPLSGEMTVLDSSQLDYETVKSFTLTVQVSDGTNTAVTTVTIHLNNLNDNRPVVKDASFHVDENAVLGTMIGTVSGSDADGDSLQYGIIAGNEAGAFAINAATGEIFVADSNQLDYETKTSYQLTVQASDMIVPNTIISPYALLTAFFAKNNTETDIATITINVNDLNDNSPVPHGFTKNIDENTANGTTVGTVTATDADAGSQFTYKITSGNNAGAFAMEAATGKITVADSGQLDYETVKSFTLTVQVSDGTNTAETTVTIHLNNLNDNTPVVKAGEFSVDENAANGTTVGTMSGSDADDDSLHYGIVAGNENEVFKIDEATGEITVADGRKLDYETKPTYELTVQVSDTIFQKDGFVSPYGLVAALSSSESDLATVIIHVNDLNDNSPVPQGFAKTIDENTANGTDVGTVTATDADAGSQLTYKITSGNAASAFAMDAATGKITVTDERQLDYETVKGFMLTIQVSDGANTADTTVTINLNNLNDNAPVAKDAAFSIDENATLGTVVGTISASDADGDLLSYSIVAGNETDAFALDTATGKITVADSAKQDYETIKSFALTVMVNDGKHTAATAVTISLNNLNDNSPVADSAVFTVDENAANGTTVGTVTARDTDGDSLSYSIVSGNETDTFALDGATGKITVTDSAQLDYETIESYQLTVQVSDGTNTAATSVTIHVNNLNDNRPVAKDSSIAVDENAANGTVVGTVTASDADGDPLTFRVVKGNEADAFTIDGATGKITVADEDQLDYEAIKSFILKIEVSDGTNLTDAAVTINVNNLNDNEPVGKDAVFTVDENAANGTGVGTVAASDADGDSLGYRIVSGNETDVFALDTATGKITVADGSQLDYETIKSFALKVQVSDGTHTVGNVVTITVNNLNDNAPVGKDGEFSIDENAENGAAVGTIDASDADGDDLSYRFTDGNDAGAFALDDATGKITVAESSPLDYENAKSFALEVLVSDGTHTAKATVTINLTNLNDNPPVGKDAAFTIDEEAANGTALGTVTARDADGDAVKYTILAGNDEGIFTMNETTGEITVAGASLLDAAAKAHHTLTVRVSDGQHTAALTVTIHVLSSDVTLSQLTSNHGDLNPAFKPGTTHYSLNVGEGVHTIKLTPTATNPNATVKINGKVAVSSQESDAIRLDKGKNTITIVVTAQNGQKATYTLTVTRLQKVVTADLVREGETVTVSDEAVNLLDYEGTLVIELKKGLNKVKTVKFTAEQLETLIKRHAMIKIVKEDVQLLIPAANFAKGIDLVISLEKVEKNPKKLPSSDLAVSAVYDFTIKQGGKIISHFDQDIELAFPTAGYDHPEKLKVYYWNEAKTKWEIVGGTFKDGQIKTATDHFSTFAVFHPSDLVVEKPSPGTDSPGEKPSSGSDLPKTATTMYNWLFAGILFLITGGCLFLVQQSRQKDRNS